MTTRGRPWLFWSLLLVLVALVAALLAGPLLLDQERYRTILISRVGQLLNRTVTASSLRAQLLPSPGLTIQNFSIADRAPWSEPFLDAKRFHITLKLLPLLRGAIQISDIRMDEVRIRLAKGPDGWNFDDLIHPSVRATATEPRHADSARVARGPSALPVLVAGALTIRDGTIVLDNPLRPYGPGKLELKNISLDIPDPLPSHPLRILMSGQLPGDTSSSFELIGSLQRNETDHTPFEVEFHVRGLEAARLTSAIGLSRVSFASALSGAVDLDGKVAGGWPRLDLEVNADLQRLGPAPARQRSKTAGDKSWLRAKGRWEDQSLDLPEVSLLWKGQTIAGRLHFTTKEPSRLRFWLNTPELSIEPIVALATIVDGGMSQVNDPSASFPTSHPPTPSPPISSDRRGGNGEAEGGLQVEGHLQSGVLRWGKLLLTDAEGDLRYCCRRLTLRRLRGGFYGGTLTGDAALDWRGSPPRATVATHLEGVQAEPLLSAIRQPQWTLRGVMTLDSKIGLSGPFGPGALARVSAQSDMAMTDGRVTGYAPLERLSKTIDPVLKGLGVPALTLNEFDRLNAHWALDGGILRTKDLTLLRNGARFYVAGSFNLLNQTMDLDVTAKVAKTTLEAKVQGPSSDPVITPQAGSIEGRIKTQVGKLLGKDGHKELGKMLQQLFSR